MHPLQPLIDPTRTPAGSDDLARLRSLAEKQGVKLKSDLIGGLIANAARELNGEEPLLVASHLEGRGLVVVTDGRVIGVKGTLFGRSKSWPFKELKRAKKGQMGIYVELKLWKGDRFLADEVFSNIRPQRQARRIAEFVNDRIEQGSVQGGVGGRISPVESASPPTPSHRRVGSPNEAKRRIKVGPFTGDRKGFTIAAVVIAVCVAGFLIFSRDIPDVTGLSVDGATQLADEHDLSLEVEGSGSGKICRQEPAAESSSALPGDTLTVFVGTECRDREATAGPEQAAPPSEASNADSSPAAANPESSDRGEVNRGGGSNRGGYTDSPAFQAQQYCGELYPGFSQTDQREACVRSALGL